MRESETPKAESPAGQADAAAGSQGGERAMLAESAQARAAEAEIAEQKAAGKAAADGAERGMQKALDRL